MTNLQNAFQCLSYPLDLPHALPLAHLTVAQCLGEIMNGRCLIPQESEVFDRELIYFSYGGIFHRLGNKPMTDPLAAPIAFVFSPGLLDKISWYYPYDTGAAHKGKYGSWSQKLQNFDKFRLHGSGNYALPRKLVGYIYGSNTDYLRQDVSPLCQKGPEPLSELCNFLSADLTSEGVDHRKCLIECQVESPISLLEDLLWIGFPELYSKVFYDLWDFLQRQPPKLYPYPSGRIFIPDEWAHSLHEKAKEQVLNDYIEFRGQEGVSAS